MTRVDPMAWMASRVPGFSELSEEDRQAIFQFTMLWSYFEAEILDARGNANAIASLIYSFADRVRENIHLFENDLGYFRGRYFSGGRPTFHYSGLHLRRNDKEELVRSVLSGEDVDPVNSIVALLIIIFRLRNNLFHGLKWANEFRGQQENLVRACAILIVIMEVVA